MPNITCYDLLRNKVGENLGIIFPGWKPGRERVVFISPHDDDAALGAGYLILACRQAGAEVHILIMCDGRAGYTRPELKETIVDLRRLETEKAYAKLGIKKDEIHRFEYPDFSLHSYLSLELPGGTEGAFGKVVKLLRKIKATRLVIPNGWMEHPDHTAAHDVGAFHGPQAGDPIIPDRGKPSKIKTYLVYAVWGDLPPLEKEPGIRADLILEAPRSFEKKIADSLKCFDSQSDIIEGLLKARSGRIQGNKVIEVYKRLVPRSMLDYKPYWNMVEKLSKKGAKM